MPGSEAQNVGRLRLPTPKPLSKWPFDFRVGNSTAKVKTPRVHIPQRATLPVAPGRPSFNLGEHFHARLPGVQTNLPSNLLPTAPIPLQGLRKRPNKTAPAIRRANSLLQRFGR